ncbi:hypothetical protein LCGC14_2390580, partial [marine sediment metagenome]
MSSRALNGHIDQANFVLATVWYETNAALIEGQAVCYNYDYTGGGATVAEGSRSNRVESVSATNAQWFAGVSSAEYSAVSGGQFIDIYLPGSVCNIALNTACPNTVVGQGLFTFDVTAAVIGQFLRTGMPGAGSAVPLQTTSTG